jgi:putative ABC transport system ATP-binding protein
MSGGQKQRVALPAPDTNPRSILADEPTGASIEDQRGGDGAAQKLNAESTRPSCGDHESGVANETNKIIRIKDGLIGAIEENLDHNASPFGTSGYMK